MQPIKKISTELGPLLCTMIGMIMEQKISPSPGQTYINQALPNQPRDNEVFLHSKPRAQLTLSGIHQFVYQKKVTFFLMSGNIWASPAVAWVEGRKVRFYGLREHSSKRIT